MASRRILGMRSAFAATRKEGGFPKSSDSRMVKQPDALLQGATKKHPGTLERAGADKEQRRLYPNNYFLVTSSFLTLVPTCLPCVFPVSMEGR